VTTVQTLLTFIVDHSYNCKCCCCMYLDV